MVSRFVGLGWSQAVPALEMVAENPGSVAEVGLEWEFLFEEVAPVVLFGLKTAPVAGAVPLGREVALVEQGPEEEVQLFVTQQVVTRLALSEVCPE